MICFELNEEGSLPRPGPDHHLVIHHIQESQQRYESPVIPDLVSQQINRIVQESLVRAVPIP